MEKIKIVTSDYNYRFYSLIFFCIFLIFLRVPLKETNKLWICILYSSFQ